MFNSLNNFLSSLSPSLSLNVDLGWRWSVVRCFQWLEYRLDSNERCRRCHLSKCYCSLFDGSVAAAGDDDELVVDTFGLTSGLTTVASADDVDAGVDDGDGCDSVAIGLVISNFFISLVTSCGNSIFCN